ncbi:MAG TPA: phosphatase PAP2 family protein [Tangfeifania sp.]|nr:phosphatase PAP2 family protein [Tangfeifania sp.]
MKETLKENKYFLLPWLLTLVVFTGLILTHNKAELHLISNNVNSLFFDQFFRYATWLGDGVMIAIVGVVLLFVRFRYAIAFLIGSLVTAGIVNLFKKVLLDDMYRPSKYFELYESAQLHLIEGVKLHSLQSFPSGHTATAFSVFFFLALILKSKPLKLSMLLLAIVVAYSRVYISQHFLIDITAGSAIAVLIMFFTYLWMKSWNKEWLDSSVLSKSTQRA